MVEPPLPLEFPLIEEPHNNPRCARRPAALPYPVYLMNLDTRGGGGVVLVGAVAGARGDGGVGGGVGLGTAL